MVNREFLRRPGFRDRLSADLRNWRPSKLNDRARLFLVGIALMVLVAGLTAWVYVPLAGRLEAVGAELRRQREDYAYGQTISARLETIEANIAEAGLRLAALDQRVPQGNEVPEFVRSCGQSAREAGARIWEISVGDPAPSGGYLVQTARLVVTGSYRDQVEFVAGLEGLDRLVLIDTVEMIPGDWQEARRRLGQTGTSFRTDSAAGNVVTALYEAHIFSETDAGAGKGVGATTPAGDGAIDGGGAGRPGSGTSHGDRESPFMP